MKKAAKKKDFPARDRYFGVLLEKMESNFRQVLEGHAALDKKIDDFREEFIDFTNEANWKFKEILDELKEFKEGRFAELEKRINRLEKWASSRN